MNKPGRPRKNGQQDMYILERITLALFAYGRARDAGEKHSVAISEAVKYVRETIPAMPISETEVKRIVAGWRSKERPMCLLVTKPGLEHSLIRVPGRDGKWVDARILYTASVGPRPISDRAKAAKKPGEIGMDCQADCGRNTFREN
jgi:hypothetical protein